MEKREIESFFNLVSTRPVAIFMITVSLLVFGAVSYQRLPLNLMPKLNYPKITLRTEFPGASPYEVETLISEPMEEALGILPNLVKITSISRPGTSEITCEFSWKTNVQSMILEIREHLDRIRIPDGAERPLILRYDPSLDPILRIALSGEKKMEEIRYLAEEDIKRELESLKGVASVVVRGGSPPIVAVSLMGDRMSHYKISPQMVETRLKQENINLAGGSLREGEVLYLVRILNEFKSIEEISNLILLYRDRVPVRLKDVAKVKERAKEKKVTSRVWGKEAVEILIYKEADANMLEVASRVKKRCFGPAMGGGKKPIQETVENLKMTILSDSSIYVQSAIEEVKSSAFYGALLAIVVLLFFLHDFKHTLIIALSIPLSLIVTFAPMNMMNLSLNIMSLGGLALSAGMVVDNAIVVLEAIFRRREEGLSFAESAVSGTQEVAAAVTASTLTTIAVFFPIVFVEGIAGQIFTDQSLTVTFSLTVSLLVALFFIPALAAVEVNTGERRWNSLKESLFIFESLKKFGREWRFLNQGKKRFLLPLALVWMLSKGILFFLVEVMGKILFLLMGLAALLLMFLLRKIFALFSLLLWIPFRIFDGFFWAFHKTYIGILRGALKNKAIVLILTVSFCLFSLTIFSKLGAQLLPDLHQGEFYQEILLSPGTALEQTDKILMDTQLHFKKDSKTFLLISSRAGSDEDDLEGKGEEGGRIYVRLPAGDLEQGEIKAVRILQKYLSSLPDLELLQISKPQLLSFRTPIEVEVKGYDLEELRKTSQKLSLEMKKLAMLKNIRVSMKPGTPEIRVGLNRDKLIQLGLNAESVANLIKAQFKGEKPTYFRTQGERKEIWIQLREEDRSTLDDLRNLNIIPQGEQAIPLKGVSKIEVSQGPQEIRRIDHSRTAVIQADVVGLDLEGAVKNIQKILKSASLPPQIAVSLGGQYQEMVASLQSLYFALILAAFLVYVVMASIFESLVQPFVIMFTLPFAFVGVGWTLYLLGMALDVMVLIGAVMLAGIVVNNAIVLVDKINQLREENRPLEEAIVESASIRIRPILMTTLTTIVGLLPMALGIGEGSELRKPMAITVLAGLTTSTILTLVLIPLTYALWEGWWEKRKG